MNRQNGKNRLFSFRYLLHDFVKVTATVPGVIWFRPKWIYETDAAKKRIRGGAVIISNHDGFYDPVYLMFAVWYRRQHFVCMKEFFDSKFGWLFKAFLCIPVDRNNFGIGSLRAIVDEAKRGGVVTIFPEGHINNEESGGLSSFKSGMVLMALQAKVPVVPVYVAKRKRFYSRLKCVIGEPIDIIKEYGERPTFTQIEAIASKLQSKEESLKNHIK